MDESGSSEVDVAGARGGMRKLGPLVETARHRFKGLGALIASVAAVGAVLSGLAGYWTTFRIFTKEFRKEDLAETRPERASIVVLPFENIGNDPSQEYLAEGVTINLTTELSVHIQNILVVQP